MIFSKKTESSSEWRLSSEREPGWHTASVIDKWVADMPSGSILDLAAGQGIESKYLASKHSRRVVAYDKSFDMIQNAVFPVKHGDILKLDYGHQLYSGALIKDLWVFLNPTLREQLLDKLYHGLVNGGSVLIMSQWSDTRAHIISTDSNFPRKLLLSDYYSASDWISAIKSETSGGGKVLSIEYDVDYETLASEASSAGFSADIREHGMGSGLSMENRWKQSQQLVAKLTK